MRQRTLPRARLMRLAVVLTLWPIHAFGAAEIHVAVESCPGPGSGEADDPYCAIQSAVDVAVDGDAVVVAPGTYNDPIDLMGKSITLRSAEGAAVTILDGPAVGSRIRIVGGAKPNVVIVGFTFVGAQGTLDQHCTGIGIPQTTLAGGAIYSIESNVTVRSCVFEGHGNDAGDSVVAGGAIYLEKGNSTISDSEFSFNAVEGTNTVYGSAVGACGNSGSLTVSRSVFTSNGRPEAFGAVFARGMSLTVEESRFVGNEAAFGGGVSSSVGKGFFLTDDVVDPGTVIIRDSSFVQNSASFGGGASVQVTQGGSGFVLRSEFLYNEAKGGGLDISAVTGDLSEPDPEVYVDGVVLHGNIGSWGGGLNLSVSTAGSIRVANCLAVDNHAVGVGTAVLGGGIRARIGQGGSVSISNCTLYGNSASFAGGGIAASVSDFPGALIDLTNSIVRSNAPNQVEGAVRTRYNNIQFGALGEGNIDVDPRFVDPDGADDVIGTPDDNFRLRPGSGVIDAGNEFPISRWTPVDLEGHPRFVDDPVQPNTGAGSNPFVDMGPYESPHGNLIRFTTDTTIVWPLVGFLQQSNVYRGSLASLGGIGSGTCVNALDTDVTDEAFIDTTVPAVGQGLFYLQSVVDRDGVECCLGTTGSGQDRRVSAPCPLVDPP